MSHGVGALLRALMFPGPLQFFHSETQRRHRSFIRDVQTHRTTRDVRVLSSSVSASCLSQDRRTAVQSGPWELKVGQHHLNLITLGHTLY